MYCIRKVLTQCFARYLGRTTTAIAIVAAAPLSDAASYTFWQGGYEDDASVSGSFTGADANDDGILSFFDLGGISELTNFTMSFSGNSIVDAFSFDLTNLDSFVFFLGDNLLGNDVSSDLTSLDFEGIAAFSSDFVYPTGQGPTLTDGGFIYGPDNSTQSASPVIVAQQGNPVHVPDAGSSVLLLGLGLSVVFVARRFRR